MKCLKLTLILTVFVLALSACGNKSVNNPATDEPTRNDVNAVEEKVIVKSQSLSDEVAEFTEVVSYVGDCDGDGNDETIILSTAAERDNKGEFLWNDGQDWALYVKDNANNAYILYNEYVQAGNVYFDVSDYYMSDGAKPMITVTVSTGAGLTVKNYSFSNADNGYVEDIVYETQSIAEGGINRRFTSVPEITK